MGSILQTLWALDEVLLARVYDTYRLIENIDSYKNLKSLGKKVDQLLLINIFVSLKF